MPTLEDEVIAAQNNKRTTHEFWYKSMQALKNLVTISTLLPHHLYHHFMSFITIPWHPPSLPSSLIACPPFSLFKRSQVYGSMISVALQEPTPLIFKQCFSTRTNICKAMSKIYYCMRTCKSLSMGECWALKMPSFPSYILPFLSYIPIPFTFIFRNIMSNTHYYAS